MLEDAIRDCNERFGPTPRTHSLWDRLTYLRVDRPSWLWWNWSDKLTTIFRHVRSVFREGTICWGCVIQANRLLFEDGADDCPGELVYSLADPSRVEPLELRRIAAQLFSLKGTQPANPELASIAAYLTDQRIRVFGLEVPRAISPNTPCRISTTLFIRKHLPLRRLCYGLLPIVVNRCEPYVALALPARYWSPELTLWWISR